MFFCDSYVFKKNNFKLKDTSSHIYKNKSFFLDRMVYELRTGDEELILYIYTTIFNVKEFGKMYISNDVCFAVSLQ